MNKRIRIAVAAAAAVTMMSGAATAVAPTAEAKTTTIKYVDFKLDAVTTQLVASDPVQAAAKLARTQGGGIVNGDVWFAALITEFMGQAIRESKSPRPCLVGTLGFASRSDLQYASGGLESSCTRLVPEFKTGTMKYETPQVS